MKYFLTLLNEMGLRGSEKEETKLIRQNYFPLTYIKLVYFLIRKKLKSNSLDQNICMFLRKETSHIS